MFCKNARLYQLLIVCLLFACSAEESTTLFESIPADESGVGFSNPNTETETDNIFTFEYFYNGAGVTAGDVNHDGLPDLYFSSNQGDNKLYLNKGDFQFEDVTDQAGVAATAGWKTGVSMIDLNQDGWLDLYVCRTKSANPELRKNLLYINNGNLTFTERSADFGLDDDSFSTQALFFDVDRDADLDVFMLNHSSIAKSNAYKIEHAKREASASDTRYVSNRLLLNQNGKFEDASRAYGIEQTPSNFGLGAAVADINNDGWPDLYTSCDYTGSDKLYINKQGKKFVDATDSLLSHISLFSMGLDIADINNDGLLDILTLDMLPPDNARQKKLFVPDRYEVFQNMVSSGLHYQYMRNMLHLNNGDGTFSEVGQLAGLSATDWSWAPLMADFDNDGRLDVFITNSFKRDFTDNDFIRYRANEQLRNQRTKRPTLFSTLVQKMPAHQFKNFAFHNLGDLQFSNRTTAWGFDQVTSSTGGTYADLDADGDLDIILNNLNGPAALYKNHANQSKNNWLQFTLQPLAGTSNVSARVTIYYAGEVQVRELNSARGFQSATENKIHFGLGSVLKVDSVVVLWPNGSVQKNFEIKLNSNNLILQSARVNPQPIPVLPNKWVDEWYTNITFQHQENSFIDFKVQPLLPRAFSTQGPALAVADVNHDALPDYYFGGAAGQAGELWVQQKNGLFKRTSITAFMIDAASEDVDAIFFDADNDSDLDLYVVSGGYEFKPTDRALQDRLYRNDGAGNFRKSEASLPEMMISGSCARAADVDDDGDMDLFVAGRVVPGRYPESPPSKILINNGGGVFSDGTQQYGSGFEALGLITDAFWVDLNKDSKPDLITCGEWTPIQVHINENNRLVNRTSMYFKEPLYGWWNCLTAADLDGDGDQDVVAGNMGLNNQMKATQKEPVTLVYSDFDSNGSVDPVLNYFIQGKSYPYATRDELADQLPSIKKKFNSFQSYSTATIGNIITPAQLQTAKTLVANSFQSVVLLNQENKTFTPIPLPLEAQFSPMFSVIIADLNNDSMPDLITGGNLSSTRVRWGKQSGNTGFVFLGQGEGNFKVMPPSLSALGFNHDQVRKMSLNGKTLVVSFNNSRPRFYRMRE